MSIALLFIAFLFAVGSLNIRQTVPALISFISMMFVLGLFYISLDEKLLALFQIFVYTGGIMVLMLFGVTIIGDKFDDFTLRPIAVLSSVLIFVALSVIFFKHKDTLLQAPLDIDNALFVSQYSDFIIIFGLIGVSLLYGTVKMVKVLKKRSRDV